ncbi:Uncharacterized protein dnm_094050 [Desulfonema magnum]|uniref:Uncharacterized protein n=1 Tax=Desulfonema magnum TaxID=45655 RepID=A0A975BXU2_9BACT|nr:Uncharacterized protein dnm_094050 [Desulfonema magnum]
MISREQGFSTYISIVSFANSCYGSLSGCCGLKGIGLQPE